MQFQFSTTASQLPQQPVVPQQPVDVTDDLLRQLVELYREGAAHQRDTLTQLLAVQQEQLNQARAAAADAQALAQPAVALAGTASRVFQPVPPGLSPT